MAKRCVLEVRKQRAASSPCSEVTLEGRPQQRREQGGWCRRTVERRSSARLVLDVCEGSIGSREDRRLGAPPQAHSRGLFL